MLEEELGQADAAALRLLAGDDRGPDVLVDDPAEADPRVVAEQPELPVRGEAGPWPEQQPVADKAGSAQLRAHRDPVALADPLVRVDVQDPLAAGQLKGTITGGGEVAGPGQVVDPRSRVPGDVPAPVRGPGIDDDDLVGQADQRLKAGFEELLLVPDDQGRRYQHGQPESGS